MLLRPRVHISPRGAAFTALVVIAVLIAGTPGVHAGEWEWEIAPYIWFTDVRADVSLNETDILSETIDFSNIIDEADLGALVHFEGRNGRWGLFVDVVYLALSGEQTRSGDLVILAGTTIEVEIDQLIGELGGIYRLTGDDRVLDLLFGARVMDVSLDISLDFPAVSGLADRSRSSDETLFDGFIGLRYGQDISDRWLWSIRGDVGAGDTDLTWQGVLNLGVNFGKERGQTLFFGYRHLAYEVEEGNSGITKREIAFSGPEVGYRFTF